jgi:Rps23 Pro-64 3,4-dihydroxylase Tpa1-like proline 4-hydroxylase
MQNKNLRVEKFTNPYPFWIIDNFLKDEVIKEIKNSWIDSDSKIWHNGHRNINGKENILENGMLGISKKEMMPEYISKVIDYLHSDEFTKILGELIGLDELVSDNSMRWSGMRTMLPGAHQLIHSDTRRHPENGLRKELSCLIYFREDYDKERDEGCLEIWGDDMKVRHYEIEPINNRLVIFLNSDTSYHGVPNVKSERRSITFSVLKKGDSTNRTKALFVRREEDSLQVEKLGKERSLISDNNKF